MGASHAALLQDFLYSPTVNQGLWWNGLSLYKVITAHKPTRSEADVGFQIIRRLPFLWVRSFKEHCILSPHGFFLATALLNSALALYAVARPGNSIQPLRANYLATR